MSWEGVLKAKVALRRKTDEIMADGEARTARQIQEIMNMQGFRYGNVRAIAGHLSSSSKYEKLPSKYEGGERITTYRLKGDLNE